MAVGGATQYTVVMDSGTGSASKRSLGEIRIEAFDQDLAVNERYQKFSEELLRLALLAIGGVGYLVAALIAPHKAGQTISGFGQEARILLLAAAVSMSVAAIFALVHRYVSSDLLAFQLRMLRLQARNQEDDAGKATKERDGLNTRWKIAGPSLGASAAFLLLGAVFFVLSLVRVLGR